MKPTCNNCGGKCDEPITVGGVFVCSKSCKQEWVEKVIQ